MKLIELHVVSLCLAVFLFVEFAALGEANVGAIQIELSGYVSNDDARQIRRLLRPWADPEDVVFKPAYDKKKRKRHFSTVVEITPRWGKNSYSESHTFDIYNIMRQLNDQRFRGSQIGPRPRVAKTEATVSGDLIYYHGWSRSHIRDVPNWRRWRGHTSEIGHALYTGRANETVVFSGNDKFDELRREVSEGVDEGKGDPAVEVEGKIVGFDGPFPVMSIRKFRVEYKVEMQSGDKGRKQKDESYDYLEKSLPESDETSHDDSPPRK